MEFWIFSLWITGLIIKVGIAIALYHMAEKRYGNGVLWGMIGFVFDILGLLIYFGFVYFEASMSLARGKAEEQRVARIMKQQRQEQKAAEYHKPNSGRDDYLHEMMARNQWQAAETHAKERLRAAHELGDVYKENYYRQALRELDEKTGGGRPATGQG